MANFGFIKSKNIIPFVQPKVFWTPENGIKFGRSGLELFRFNIACFKKGLAQQQSIEIYKYFNTFALFAGAFLAYKGSMIYNQDKDSLVRSTESSSDYKFQVHSKQAVKINNQLQ